MGHYLGGSDVKGVASVPSCANAFGARVLAHDAIKRSAGIVDQRVNVTIIALDVLECVFDRRIVLNVDLDGDDI